MRFKILCGGPISEDKDVYAAHIAALLNQGRELYYKGIDNSPEPLSAPLGFADVQWRRETSLGEYKQGRIRFNRERLRKMGEWREEMRIAAVDGGYDYLFMVDSDLVLGPDTLQQLLDANKDYIAGLIWTDLRPGRRHQWPNCWRVDDNKNHRGHVASLPEGLYRSDYDEEFMAKLRSGGIYEVGLTGACCLIAKKALPVVNYSPYQGSIGDDEWLTISARKAGIPLFIHADVKIEHRRRR